MLPMHGIRLDSKAASEFADYHSLSSDLSIAAEMFDHVAAHDADAPHTAARGVWWQAGVISYRRAFGSGRASIERHGSRLRASTLLRHLSDEERRVHKSVIAEANKHTAHRAGDGEQAQVHLLLDNPLLGRAIGGLGVLSLRRIAPEPAEAHSAATVARRLSVAASEAADQVADRILAEYAAQDLASLYERSVPMTQ
jgi:hypothetical protein